MSDKIREAIERWYLESRGLPYPCDGAELHRDEEGGYHFRDPADAWRAWQAALSQQPAPVAVPDGWKLVPVEPTPKMVDVALRRGIKRSDWEELLAAAPAPAPAAQEPVAWVCTAHKQGITEQRSLFHGEQGADVWLAHFVSRGCEVTKTPLYTAPPAAEQPSSCQQCAGTGYDCPDCIAAAEQPDTVPVPRELLERATNPDSRRERAFARAELRAMLSKEGEA